MDIKKSHPVTEPALAHARAVGLHMSEIEVAIIATLRQLAPDAQVAWAGEVLALEPPKKM